MNGYDFDIHDRSTTKPFQKSLNFSLSMIVKKVQE